jgi:hypothetical protein
VHTSNADHHQCVAVRSELATGSALPDTATLGHVCQPMTKKKDSKKTPSVKKIARRALCSVVIITHGLLLQKCIFKLRNMVALSSVKNN